MAPVLSRNPKAEETAFPRKIINPDDVVPVEDHIINSIKQTTPHLGKIQEGIFAYNISGADIFFLEAHQFYYVLYRENPNCWKTTYLVQGDSSNEKRLRTLELINTDSLEVKGFADMRTFVAGRTYEVRIWFKMNKDAQFDSPCRFTLVIADGPRAKVAASSLSVDAIQAEKLVSVKLGEFTGTGNEGEVRFSLTNFDPNWKSGIVLVGLFIVPASA